MQFNLGAHFVFQRGTSGRAFAYAVSSRTGTPLSEVPDLGEDGAEGPGPGRLAAPLPAGAALVLPAGGREAWVASGGVSRADVSFWELFSGFLSVFGIVGGLGS